MTHNPEIDFTTEAMLTYAQSLGIGGTAVAYFVSVDFNDDISIDQSIATNRVSRPRDSNRDRDGKRDVGTNYVGMATGKTSRRLRLELGDDTALEPHNGEPEARGDVALNLGSVLLILAFSGGTEDQDVEISQYGMDAYLNRYVRD